MAPLVRPQFRIGNTPKLRFRLQWRQVSVTAPDGTTSYEQVLADTALGIPARSACVDPPHPSVGAVRRRLLAAGMRRTR